MVLPRPGGVRGTGIGSRRAVSHGSRKWMGFPWWLTSGVL